LFSNLLCLGDSFGVPVLLLFDSCFVTSLQIIILQSYTIGKNIKNKINCIVLALMLVLLILYRI
jgi:hypothetical protein